MNQHFNQWYWNQGSHSTMKTMKMELNHENHEKKHENLNLSNKTMKTEISGQNFPKIFACGGQNDLKFSLVASKIVNKFCVQNMKFSIKIWRRQSSI